MRGGLLSLQMLLSNFDRYRPTLAVEANIPPFQDIPSDYARIGCFLVEISRKDLHRRDTRKPGTGEANRAAILLCFTIAVQCPDREFRIREEEIAIFGKDLTDDCKR